MSHFDQLPFFIILDCSLTKKKIKLYQHEDMDASISNHPSSTKMGGSRYKLTRAQLSSLEKPLRKGMPLTSAFGACDGLDKRNFWWYNGKHILLVCSLCPFAWRCFACVTLRAYYFVTTVYLFFWPMHVSIYPTFILSDLTEHLLFCRVSHEQDGSTTTGSSNRGFPYHIHTPYLGSLIEYLSSGLILVSRTLTELP